MNIILIVFLLLCLIGLKFTKDNENYVSPLQTQQINGIFVFLILMSHFVTYIDISLPIHSFYLEFRYFLKQLVVVTFLFFSGYGMFESFKIKKEKYVQKIPKRFLKLLFQFDLAVLFFFILAIFLGKEMTFKHIILSFLAWEGFGNSYWYIFVVLSLYVFMYISFRIANNKIPLSLIIFSLSSILLIWILIYAGKTSNWYNTIMSFVAGMWFSYLKDKFDYFVNKNNYNYVLTLILFIFIFSISHAFMFKSLIAYEIMGIFFCLSIVTISKKVKMNNPVLKFLGHHIFSIYILQRIPMIIGEEIGFQQNFMVYFIFVLLTTIVLSCVFDQVVSKLEKIFFY